MKQDNSTLTKDEAIEAMLKGKKVTHLYFTDNEWTKLNGSFEIEFEDGVKINVDDFWKDRKMEGWQTGWSIYPEQSLPSKEETIKEENTRLKERIEGMEVVLRECYGYFSAPNFTDRYGTAERIKEALKQVTK
jgi:hypothetical protein